MNVTQTPVDVPDGFRQVDWTEGFGCLVGPIFENESDQPPYVRAFRVMDHHVNRQGICHGGMLSAFADMSFGNLVSRTRTRRWVTVRLLTDFLSSGQIGDWIVGGGQIVGEDNGLVSVEGRVWCGDRTLLVGSSVLKILDKPRPTGG